MSEIRFYHLQTQALEQALPQIISKALSGDHRVLVRTADAQEAERLNDALWTYRPDSFLPHGTAKDGNEAEQPVFLTDKDENPNKASVLVLTGGSETGDLSAYNICCEMFDGRDAGAVKAARARWKIYKEAGHELTYWQQNERGGWDKK